MSTRKLGCWPNENDNKIKSIKNINYLIAQSMVNIILKMFANFIDFMSITSLDILFQLKRNIFKKKEIEKIIEKVK